MLYLITNRKIIKQGNLYSIVESAVIGGIDRVILREKDLSYEKLLLTASILKPILSKYNVPLIINTNLEVAKSLNADGFHIGFQNIKNKKIEFKGILGISVHNLEEAIAAENLGADYLLAGHIYKTDCKKGLKPKGIKLIKDIKANVNIPVIALGGINEKNAPEVISAGADGIAVMSYIMSSKFPYLSAKILKSAITLK
ncbi:thiamine-phosphate pyrophosphorylase [Caminicella sporogenes DSM 14501]|uniref:Thiamine-phosphate synthase n=1 Tax=Caminicella sporogenes DSM 14501 TaxID=1121266 RepID=A0A1M6RPP4_9FIRM|nr:thiamine phosphate synthase [Caminicella sporogenes]SHK34415.1 thiamine-phosphate pyrophosphorylase [Caminicella sporogenes DSM 14501]